MVMDRPITRVPRVSRVALSADHQIQTDSATPHYRIHQYWLTGGLFFSGWLLPVELSTKFRESFHNIWRRPKVLFLVESTYKHFKSSHSSIVSPPEIRCFKNLLT